MSADDVPAHAKVRYRKRAEYDAEVVNELLDRALYGHVGFIVDDRPMVIPMIFARDGDTIYLHGSVKTRIMSDTDGANLCLTVTHTDGIVVARSAFNHSINYRGVVVHGRGTLVTDHDERQRAMQLLTEHLLPGRWSEVRPMSDTEIRATGIIAMQIDAASAKIRSGGPNDEPGDYDLAVWAGVIPVTTALGAPIDDNRLAKGTELPASLAAAKQRFG